MYIFGGRYVTFSVYKKTKCCILQKLENVFSELVEILFSTFNLSEFRKLKLNIFFKFYLKISYDLLNIVNKKYDTCIIE